VKLMLFAGKQMELEIMLSKISQAQILHDFTRGI
jgi:hypothetical protein